MLNDLISLTSIIEADVKNITTTLARIKQTANHFIVQFLRELLRLPNICLTKEQRSTLETVAGKHRCGWLRNDNAGNLRCAMLRVD